MIAAGSIAEPAVLYVYNSNRQESGVQEKGVDFLLNFRIIIGVEIYF